MRPDVKKLPVVGIHFRDRCGPDRGVVEKQIAGSRILGIGAAGRGARTDVWVEDASIAATFIQLKAEELGLGSCWVQMRERGTDDGHRATDNIAELLGIPSGYEVECVIAVGHKLHERSPYEVDKLPTEHIHENKF